MKTSHGWNPGRFPIAVFFASIMFWCVTSLCYAFPFEYQELSGSFDTTFSYGMQWRLEKRDADLIGIANGGKAFSVNGDDGNLNYDRGLTSSALKATHDFGLDYRNYSSFLRATYFVDFYNIDKDELSSRAQRGAGRDFEVLDAYVRGQYQPWDRDFDLRLGNQVLSWGESLFIQNGINVINPIDLSRLRIPGAELREALVPNFMVSASLQITDRLTVEGFYLFEDDQVRLDVCGSYFSTSDVACVRGENVSYGGLGMLPEGTPGSEVYKVEDRYAKDQGQGGVAFHYFSPNLLGTELGLYFMNLHSRLPYLSTIATGANPNVIAEYPENIQILGASFNTQLGNSGIAWQSEYSHRFNQPLQIENNEVISSALFFPGSQLGPAAGLGAEVRGYRRYDVGQFQTALSKAFGPNNPFGAEEWRLVGEVAVTKAFGLPSTDTLRFEAPQTDLPGVLIPGAPGVQTSGWATKSSWGYVLVTDAEYNQAIGSVNLIPHAAFAQDINGTSPGPGGNFVEGRKTLSLGMAGRYLDAWSLDLTYTRYFGAGARNVLRDRDFLSIVGKYSF